MRCRRCGHGESKVIDSRPNQEGLQIRRRRECEGCQTRFTTYEAEEAVPLVVVKKDGRREPLDREKLIRGIARACEKRPIPYEAIEGVADRIVTGLMAGRMDRDVPVGEVGDRVLAELRELDPVAYVRFMSVYRDFTSAEDFLRELASLAGTGVEREAGS